MTDLIKLLSNIANRKIQNTDLDKIFDEIAISLFRQTKIVTPNHHFYLREIEFYYSDENYPDPYPHNNPKQSEFGKWYFHRYKSIEKFLKSNRNGVDITFGNKSTNVFGGILIRKIQNIKSKEIIDGINNVVRELIKNVGKENMDNIAGKNVFDNQLLHLEIDANNCNMFIFKTQRKNLTFKKGKPSKEHYSKLPYCYFNYDLDALEVIQVYP